MIIMMIYTCIEITAKIEMVKFAVTKIKKSYKSKEVKANLIFTID
jgi:hypothetical protein